MVGVSWGDSMFLVEHKTQQLDSNASLQHASIGPENP